MGTLTYGPGMLTVELDDAVLAHLQVVFSAKLRRGESFFLSWKDARDIGGGRSSIWVDSSLPLMFTFESAARDPINRDWIEELMIASMTSAGLDLSDETRGSYRAVAQANSVKSKSSRPVYEPVGA